MAQSASLEDCVAVLQTHISSAIEKLAPLKSISPAKNSHPWFNIDHRTLIKEHDRLYRRFRRTRIAEDLLAYIQARDLAHREIEDARQNYHYTRLSQLTDPKDIWRELKHLGISSRKKSTALPFSVNELNAHFRSVSYDQNTPPVTDFLDSLASSNHLEQFTFEEIQVSVVIAAVNHFNTQARGPDGIPQHVIRLALPFLAPFICRIFNQSLREAHFPSLWKNSIVVALNKVSSPSCLSDFHPISLLRFLSKALEWLVEQQISAKLRG